MHQYFSQTGDYENLFPGLYGQCLTELRNGDVTLKRIVNTSTIAVYQTVMTYDNDVPASYFYHYGWSEEDGAPEPVECDVEYDYR